MRSKVQWENVHRKNSKKVMYFNKHIFMGKSPSLKNQIYMLIRYVYKFKSSRKNFHHTNYSKLCVVRSKMSKLSRWNINLAADSSYTDCDGLKSELTLFFTSWDVRSIASLTCWSHGLSLKLLAIDKHLMA